MESLDFEIVVEHLVLGEAIVCKHHHLGNNVAPHHPSIFARKEEIAELIDSLSFAPLLPESIDMERERDRDAD